MTKRRAVPGPIPTDREMQILRAITQHGTIGAAALSLELSRHTVDSHVDILRQRSGYHFLPQIVVWAAIHGWMELALPDQKTTQEESRETKDRQTRPARRAVARTHQNQPISQRTKSARIEDFDLADKGEKLQKAS
jgi:DNA-binding CsgD family transcriptional regulator